MRKLTMKKNQAGFNLIELTIALVVLGILAAVAWNGSKPYTDSGKVTAYENFIDHVFNGADKFKSGGANYAGMTCTILVSREYIAGKSTSCSTMGPDGLAINVVPANSNLAVRITVTTPNTAMSQQLNDHYSRLGGRFSSTVSGTTVTITRT